MDLELDAAMSKKEKIREFLTQGSLEIVSYDDMLERFKKALE
jgi:flagellum-specific ATP synthase